MGESYFKLGRKEEARQVFEKAHSLNPHSVPVLLNLGNLALDANNPALAVTYYEQAAKEGGDLLDQNEAQFGIALALLQRYREAIPHLEKGVQTFPQQAPLILEFLGDCYAALGQKDKARETYVKALLFGPKPSLKQKIWGQTL
jgi:tetratricopeptide (TPR) repeat protein